MKKVGSGIEGLDEITNGGLIQKRAYLVKGEAGTGKTTLGYHFLNEGLKNKEKCLLITIKLQ